MNIPTPASAGWHNDRGNALCDALRFAEAIAEYRRAIEIEPNYAEAYSNLGTALRDNGEIDAAIEAYERALAIRPNLAEAFNNLSIAQRDKGELEQALQSCQRALEIKPDYADAHANLGVILCDLDRGDEALAACRRAVERQPRRGIVQCNLAMILLRLSHFEEGWARYEWRYFADPRYPARAMPKPRWDGTDLNGRTLLIHAEQGFGDTIQFARYVPMAAKCGGKVLLECHPELRRLFESLPGVDRLIVKAEELPDFDAHCPMMSLPFALIGLSQAIPADPYIKPNADRVEYWRARILERATDGSANPAIGAATNPKPKIGLVWAGKPTHTDDRNRSMQLKDLAPLAQINADFFSLQKGAAAEQARQPPPGMNLIDFTNEFADYAETAAFVANMDLVIAVDTSVAHLAGALAKPVWLMLPRVADWRWMLKREDTPWYPTMRLFRQNHWRDWTGPVDRIAAALRGGKAAWM